MAAVTVTSRRRPNVIGHLRQYNYALNIATSGDTLTVAGVHSVYSVVTNNPGAITLAAASGNVVTFTSTGAVTGALVSVVGL